MGRVVKIVAEGEGELGPWMILQNMQEGGIFYG